MLGDHFLKEQGLGFTAVPHVAERVVIAPGDDAALVIASDGLWDVTSSDRAAALVARALTGGEGGACGAAEALMAHAVAQRSKDDVSLMVLRIRPPPLSAAGAPPGALPAAAAGGGARR
ncbi:hypothetical protein MNEG_16028 [Monoraphidium neglectum]|jgi:serine/threonine protein phosphatase PrpC|uniref:PPM-type phosphatase domain-containing protein n=1 Tax=Monoraphidium neglectum TaxID=145388 RepID=A0A0D2LIV0_9CHLO|nr:hypothetical protein MNEG_16028 [Monoraphidium neglectum]KIY91934.1 hypothetical protein MNEG_16028 [Monoraphidium neglectum]|eukprot:XP_013890954.1 hypothetical protein MNEG_16028 [Monoraphidium neglectum]